MTTSDSPTIHWGRYEKYCGTGVAISTPYVYGSDGDNPPRPAPMGVAISLLQSYNETPAMRAGLRSGDRLTHALTRDGWVEVNTVNAHSLLVGPIGSTVDLRVQPSDGRPAFNTTVQKAWIVSLYASDPALSLPNLESLFTHNLDRIPNRSKEDEGCELFSSLTPETLMTLTAPRFATAGSGSRIR